MTKKQSINIVQLYSNDMNIYGDDGNLLVLKRRLEWRGIEANIIGYNPGDEFPSSVDILIGGGGQDSGQNKISKDLMSISEKIHSLVDNGVPMLLVCGLYQQFGNFFKTKDGDIIKGIGVFDMETVASETRHIGNIIARSDEFGEIIGYENHSGLTKLHAGTTPLAEVIKGAGNNGVDKTEGARLHNALGTYLHGPILPKNPQMADWMIKKALENKYDDAGLTPIDDKLVNNARKHASARPR